MLATLSDSVPPLPLEICVVTTKMINERPGVVQGFINAMLNAARQARTPEGKATYIKIARQADPSGFTDEQYEHLYDFYFGPKSNPLAMDPNGGMYPEIYVSNMKSMVEEKTLDTVMPLDKLVDVRFVDQYLGNNGWYDVTTAEGGNYLRDLLRRERQLRYPEREKQLRQIRQNTPAATGVVTEAMAAPKLFVDNIHKTFFKPVKNDVVGIPALNGISFSVAAGDFVSVIGPSGCGKSTLLRIVDGLIRPDQGRVLVDGQAVNGPGPDRAVVFQYFGLYPWRSVLRNVEFGLELKGMPRRHRRDIALSKIAQVGLHGFENHFPTS